MSLIAMDENPIADLPPLPIDEQLFVLQSSLADSSLLSANIPAINEVKGEQVEKKIHYEVTLDNRSHVCPVCSKECTYPSYLVKHMRTHTGERPYKCPKINCDWKFKTSSDLTNHIRIHTRKEPYRCPECDKRFRQSTNWNAHMRTHKGVYKCSNCDEQPTNLGDWMQHKKRYHRELVNNEVL